MWDRFGKLSLLLFESKSKLFLFEGIWQTKKYNILSNWRTIWQCFQHNWCNFKFNSDLHSWKVSQYNRVFDFYETDLITVTHCYWDCLYACVLYFHFSFVVVVFVHLPVVSVLFSRRLVILDKAHKNTFYKTYFYHLL